MRVTTIAVALFAALAHTASAFASPELEERNYCAHNSCYRAVSKGPRNCPTALTSAKKDCSSFLRPTVTPCPKTTTKAVTKTVTGKPKTITSTKKSTKIATKTKTSVVFKTTTLTDRPTVTITQSSLTTTTFTQEEEVTLTSTSTATTTFSTTTRTVTTTVAPPPDATTTITETFRVIRKRSAEPTEVKRDLEERNNCPATKKATKYPGYAATCGSGSAYSSACSCLGVQRPKATTLPARISTKTVYKTTTVTPTKVVTKSTCGVTKTTTKAVPSTKVTTVTKTLPTTTRRTTTITITTTITQDEPIATTTQVVTGTSVIGTTTTTTVTGTPGPTGTCNSYTFQAVGGAYDGDFLSTAGEASSPVAFTPLGGSIFTITPEGYLSDSGNFLANIGDSSLEGVYVDTPAVIDENGLIRLTCSVTAGALSCTARGGNSNRFYSCPTTTAETLFLGDGSTVFEGCTEMTVAAVEACNIG